MRKDYPIFSSDSSNDKTTLHSRHATTRNIGSYLLVLYLKNPVDLYLLKRKTLFPSGFYIYVGSAMNSLTDRVKRHLKLDKKKKWHIDFLTEYAEIVFCVLIPKRNKIECNIAKSLNGKILLEKFGSTDCSCRSHLFYYNTLEDLLEDIEKILRKFSL